MKIKDLEAVSPEEEKQYLSLLLLADEQEDMVYLQMRL